MRKHVTCTKCKGRIKYQDELVACLIVIVLQAYHNDCYVGDSKKYIGFKSPSSLINGNAATLSALLFGPLGLLLIVFGTGSLTNYLGIVCILPAVYRLLSYFLYERHLINRIQ